jgi:hypothetical protein
VTASDRTMKDRVADYLRPIANVPFRGSRRSPITILNWMLVTLKALSRLDCWYATHFPSQAPETRAAMPR